MEGGRKLHSTKILEPGTQIGGAYCIIRLLGQGGEGSVYLVKHRMTEQLRAAKQLGGRMQGDRLHELYMMKHLHHPSLPQIIDVLETKDNIWLIMEYIKGAPLQPAGRVRAEGFFKIAEQLCEVLLYLHTRVTPILHLDIKPTNILIRPDGQLVLIDFGTSIQYQDGVENHHHLGTKGFASPEQQRVEGSADVRSDIYGFGAVMHYYLFGTVPESGQNLPKKKYMQFSFSWKKRAKKLIFRCLREEKEERIQDCIRLHRAILHQKKVYQAKKHLARICLAVFFLAAAVLFLVKEMTEEYQMNRQKEEDRYEEILERSEKLGFAYACACYREAVYLHPDDFTWAFQFLDRVTEDYLFEGEEEAVWNELIFTSVSEDGKTAKELLETDLENYSLLAYRIGMAYWYYYKESGAKYAAYQWFCEAAEAVSNLAIHPKWYETAQIHIKIGAYYEKMGRNGVDGTQESSVQIYWEDLLTLWDMEFLKTETVQIRCQIAEELLSCIMLRGYALVQEGVSVDEMKQLIESVKYFADEMEDGKYEREDVLAQCEEAEKAVERIEKVK